jgi:hypothetical protein
MRVLYRGKSAWLIFSAVLLLGGAFAQQRPTGAELTPRFLTQPPNHPVDLVQAETASLTGSALPTWRGSFKYNGVNYAFTMLGNKIGAGAGTTQIDVILVPLRLTFSDGSVLDATQNICGGSQSPVTLSEQSPIFQNLSWTPGGTNVGTTQYVDAFQRANFWSKIKLTAYAQYHTVVTIAQVMPVQAIQVPAASGTTTSGPCARVGQVDYTYFDTQINSLIKSLGIQPNTLPIFLAYNAFETSNGCCILGYHSVRGANQVYGAAAYSDPGIFPDAPGIQDIHALSHEIGDIFDNPYAGNNTPRWQSQYAPQYGCNYYLEAGDPLVGSAIEVNVGGVTYHPQELVFKSWFSKAAKSNAVNHWYSFSRTLPSPSPVC